MNRLSFTILAILLVIFATVAASYTENESCADFPKIENITINDVSEEESYLDIPNTYAFCNDKTNLI